MCIGRGHHAASHRNLIVGQARRLPRSGSASDAFALQRKLRKYSVHPDAIHFGCDGAGRCYTTKVESGHCATPNGVRLRPRNLIMKRSKPVALCAAFPTVATALALIALASIMQPHASRADPSPSPTASVSATPSASPSPSASISPAATLTPSEYGSQAYEREMKTPPPESPSPSPSVTPQE